MRKGAERGMNRCAWTTATPLRGCGGTRRGDKRCRGDDLSRQRLNGCNRCASSHWAHALVFRATSRVAWPEVSCGPLGQSVL